MRLSLLLENGSRGRFSYSKESRANDGELKSNVHKIERESCTGKENYEKEHPSLYIYHASLL